MDNLRHANEPGAAAPVGRPVPLRVLRSAETQALHWKKQAERLSALIERAGQAQALPTNYLTEARMIQAGMIGPNDLGYKEQS